MTQMYRSNKNQVEFKGKNSGTLSSSGSQKKHVFGRTNTMECFVDYKSNLNLMRQCGTIENFDRSFQKYLKTNKLNNAVEDVISLFDTDLVVRDCLGENAPEFIVDKFKEISNSMAVHGRCC